MDGMGCAGCTPWDCCPGNDFRCWGSIEEMLWWISNGPLPGPLVTTGNPALGHMSGTALDPSTKVLFGGSSMDYGTFNGLRVTLGGWIGPERTFGLEVSAFLLEERSVHFAADSNAQGNPPLYIPGYDATNGNRANSAIVADPLAGFAGGVSVVSTTRLWGTEVNGVFGAWSSCAWSGSFLLGLRYIDLLETLELQNSTETTAGTGLTSLSDRFETRNQFLGANFGAKASYQYGFWFVDVIGKIALGSNREFVDINGNSTQALSGGGTMNSVGGLLTQPTNISRTYRDEFGVIPELVVKAGVDVCNNVRVYVGYDLLYWNQVVRPGSQVDLNLNLTQSPNFGPGTLSGPARPEPLFNRTDFWANGVTFGMEVRY